MISTPLRTGFGEGFLFLPSSHPYKTQQAGAEEPEGWGDGDDSFADDPPNAVLSIFTEDEIHDVVVVLGNPALDGDQMSYNVEILDGEMPASGGASSLFIDMIGRPLSPVSVAGVRRRGRRRGRRRARRRGMY